MFCVGAILVSVASALLPTGYTYYLHEQPMLYEPNVMLGLAMMVRGGEGGSTTDLNGSNGSDSSQPSQPVPASFQFNVGTLRGGPDSIRTMATTNQIVKEFAACPAATGEG